MMRFLGLLLIGLLMAGSVSAKTPNQAQMKYACEITRGTWQELPKWCDAMHPRTFHRLNKEQKTYCQRVFNEPCECGPGMRFSIIKVLGCVRSNFTKDKAR